MKRDLDLCREILQRIENGSELYVGGPPKIEGRSEDEVRYHAILLSEAGLLWSMVQHRYPEREGFQAEGIKAGPHSGARDRYRLTWAGHEFLDAARDDTLWNDAKRKVKTNIGAIPFDLVRAVVVDMSKKLVGLE